MNARGGTTMRVRDATAADIREVQRLRAASWRAAYAGIMPPAYLDAIDTGPEAIAGAERRFLANPADQHLLVAERVGPTATGRGPGIVAFASCGPERPMPDRLRTGVVRGEVYALYAHPDAWFTGAGALLLAAARQRLHRDGRSETVLWVLEANIRARAFYERRGLRPTGVRSVLRLGGALLTELQYGIGPLTEPEPTDPQLTSPQFADPQPTGPQPTDAELADAQLTLRRLTAPEPTAPDAAPRDRHCSPQRPSEPATSARREA